MIDYPNEGEPVFRSWRCLLTCRHDDRPIQAATMIVGESTTCNRCGRIMEFGPPLPLPPPRFVGPDEPWP